MSVLDQFESSSYLSGDSADYIEALYEAYLNDQNSVSAEWQQYFSSLPAVNGAVETSHADVRETSDNR